MALATSKNFLPKIFNNWLCEKFNRGIVNRQAKDNDMESSITGNLSMCSSMLKRKMSMLAYVHDVTFYFAPGARSGCIKKSATDLCWKGIFRLGVNTR